MWTAPITDTAQLFFWIVIALVSFLVAVTAVDWKRAREDCKASCDKENDTPQEKKGKHTP